MRRRGHPNVTATASTRSRTTYCCARCVAFSPRRCTSSTHRCRRCERSPSCCCADWTVRARTQCRVSSRAKRSRPGLRLIQPIVLSLPYRSGSVQQRRVRRVAAAKRKTDDDGVVNTGDAEEELPTTVDLRRNKSRTRVIVRFPKSRSPSSAHRPPESWDCRRSRSGGAACRMAWGRRRRRGGRR